MDSDASSELILAKHWIESQNIFAADWLYGAELRLLHVQLIYAPLMLILDDWQMVRYIGALIMQAIYIASFACLVHAAGKNKAFFFRGAAFLLLPVSVTYGRIILYHNHYLPNITISFFLLALSLKFVSNVNWRSIKTWIYLLSLGILSFLGGMNSVRQLMITHAPLLLISVVLTLLEDARNTNHCSTSFLKLSNLNFLFCCIFGAGCSLIGLKCQRVICDRLGLQIGIQSENNVLSFLEAEYINDVLYGFFHQFGFRDRVPMLSIIGILSLGGIFTGIYLLFIAAKYLLSQDICNKCNTILSVFFLAYTAVMAMLFLVTRHSEPHYYYPLYLSLCFPWAVPTILTTFDTLPAEMHPLRARKLFAIVAVIVLVLNSVVNITYFLGSDRFPQVYEGLGFQNKDKKAELTEVVAYLTEEGYDKGYAGHWESNILTEMTNGDLPMVTIVCSDGYTKSGNLYYFNCLCSLWLRESTCNKPFVLLSDDTINAFATSDSRAFCSPVYEGNHHYVYNIDDLDAFINSLHY